MRGRNIYYCIQEILETQMNNFSSAVGLNIVIDLGAKIKGSH